MTAFIYSSLSKKSQLHSKLSCNWSVSGNNVHHLAYMIQAINIPRIPLYLETFKRKTTTFETLSLAQTHAHMHAHKQTYCTSPSVSQCISHWNKNDTSSGRYHTIMQSKTFLQNNHLLPRAFKPEPKNGKQKKVTGSFNKGKVCPAYT